MNEVVIIKFYGHYEDLPLESIWTKVYDEVR